VAEHFGCRTEDVLTGFKWIAALMEKYEESGEAQFIFAGEGKATDILAFPSCGTRTRDFMPLLRGDD
jgi:phosphomannomutase